MAELSSAGVAKRLKMDNFLEMLQCGEDESDSSIKEMTSSDDTSSLSSDTSDSEWENEELEVGENNRPVESSSFATKLGEESLRSPAEYNFSWSKNLENFPQVLEFLASPGLQDSVNLPDDCTPLDMYKLFVTDDILKLFKSETNKYACQCIDKRVNHDDEMPSNSRIRGWKPVTLTDIRNFLAILMHMSVVKKPKIADYWSTHPLLQTPFAKKLMSRNRFQQILWAFHLNDNSTFIPRGQPGHDPLHKLRPLLDHLSHRFQSVYMPGQQISIDESLCPWKGRSSFGVYMKDKPSKWGLKIYALCDSSNGYVWRFEVMCRMPDVSNKPFDIVHRLLEPLKSLGYCLYVDNYYCCPALALSLASENTGLVGTVGANRKGLPNDLFSHKLKKGEADYRRLKNALVIRWKDKRDVAVITTVHKPDMITVKTRTEEKRKPIAIVDYNQYMSGTNLSDQMISYVPFHRKTLKWWKKLAFHFLTLALVQARCLYNELRKKQGKPTIGQDDFVLSVGIQLAQISPEEPLETPPAAGGSEVTRLTGKHFPINTKQKRCHVCYTKLRKEGIQINVAKNKCKRTHFLCEECKKPLCVVPCFKIFHTQKTYK